MTLPRMGFGEAFFGGVHSTLPMNEQVVGGVDVAIDTFCVLGGLICHELVGLLISELLGHLANLVHLPEMLVGDEDRIGTLVDLLDIPKGLCVLGVGEERLVPVGEAQTIWAVPEDAT